MFLCSVQRTRHPLMAWQPEAVPTTPMTHPPMRLGFLDVSPECGRTSWPFNLSDGFSAESVEGGDLNTVACASVKCRCAKCWFPFNLTFAVRWPRG